MQLFRLYLYVAILLNLPCKKTCAQQPVITLESAARFDGAFAPVVHQGKKVFLHYSGNILVDKPLERLSNGGNIARKGGYAGAINSAGKIVLPFEYDEVDEDYDLHFLILKKNGKYGVADSAGRLRAAPEYDEITGLHKGAVAFKRGSQYGWISLADGRKHTSPYPLSKSYIDDHIFAQQQGDLKGLVHENGRVIAPVKYNMLYKAWPGTVIYEQNGKAGLMDINGKELCKPLYDQLSWSYEDKVVRVKQGGKTGLLNPQTSLSIPVKYTDLKTFTSGQAIAVLNGKYGVVDMNGREVVPFLYDEIRTIDALGREILNYTEERELTDSFRAYRVEKDGRHGLLAWNGKELLPPVFQGVAVATMNGRAYIFAGKDNKTALYTREGKELIPAGYEQLLPASQANSGYTYYTTDAGEAAASQMVRAVHGDRSGLFSLNGEELVPVKYTELRWAGNGLLELKNGDITTIATANGKILRKPALGRYYYMVAQDRIVEAHDGGYDLTGLDGNLLRQLPNWELNKVRNNISDSSFFYSGLMKAGDYKNTNLFFTRDGKEVRFPAYSSVEPFYQGLAFAVKNNKVGFIDSTGREVLPVEWDDIRNLAAHSNEYKKVTRNGQCGLMTRGGKTLLPVEYDNIRESHRGYFIFTKGGLAGMADSTGKVVLAPEYTSIDMNTSVHAVVLRKNNKEGLATPGGNILIPAEYDALEFNYNGSVKGWPVMVKQGNALRYIDISGRALPVTANKEMR